MRGGLFAALILLAAMAGCISSGDDGYDVTILSRLAGTGGGPHNMALDGYLGVEVSVFAAGKETPSVAWDSGCILTSTDRAGIPQFDCSHWIPREQYRVPHLWDSDEQRVQSWYPLVDGMLKLRVPFDQDYRFIIQGNAEDHFEKHSCGDRPPKYVGSGVDEVLEGDAVVEAGAIKIRGPATIAVAFGLGC